MNRILHARVVAPGVKHFVIDASKIARKRQPGQFVIVRVGAGGERIPLTIADADAEAGSISLVVQGVGKSTRSLNRLEAGDVVDDLVGPLGTPAVIDRFGTVVVIGGGVGTAIVHPVATALIDAGNEVIAIVGARHRELVLFESELRAAGAEVRTTTDDGSAGRQGPVTDELEQLIREGRSIDRIVAAGPVPMMQAVAEVSRPHRIPTVVSLNPIMVDGTGMCGGCRVSVAGETKFACVEGPEFDAHQVDFELLARRNTAYAAFERDRNAQFEAEVCALSSSEPEGR